MARRRPLQEDPENHDRWLVSYADFITLLFAFFVVMYGISSVNDQKYRELTSSLGSAFSGTSAQNDSEKNTPATTKNTPAFDQYILKNTSPPSLIQSLPLARLQKEKQRQEQESMTTMVNNLHQALGSLANNGKININKTNQGVRIDIADGVLFQAGSAEIKAEAGEPIHDIVKVLANQPYSIQIEGHTDNLPIKTSQFPSNWELSAVRATSMVRRMIENGIGAERLSAVGYSDTQPIAGNDSAEGRAQNRRVSIMVLYKKPEKPQIETTEP